MFLLFVMNGKRDGDASGREARREPPGASRLRIPAPHSGDRAHLRRSGGTFEEHSLTMSFRIAGTSGSSCSAGFLGTWFLHCRVSGCAELPRRGRDARLKTNHLKVFTAKEVAVEWFQRRVLSSIFCERHRVTSGRRCEKRSALPWLLRVERDSPRSWHALGTSFRASLFQGLLCRRATRRVFAALGY